MRGNTLRIGTIRGTGKTLVMSPEARSMHLYITGSSGVGKSKLLEHLIRQDIYNWKHSKCGLLLLDPHGSVYENILAWLARNRLDALKRPVVLVDLSQDDKVVAYNVLRQRQHANQSVIIDSFVEAIAHVWDAANTTATPLFASWASDLLTMLYASNLKLAEARELLVDYRRREFVRTCFFRRISVPEMKIRPSVRTHRSFNEFGLSSHAECGSSKATYLPR